MNLIKRLKNGYTAHYDEIMIWYQFRTGKIGSEKNGKRIMYTESEFENSNLEKLFNSSNVEFKKRNL